ncbi:hypothetical protein H0H92_011018 [Tricholoma furcatifolium]|nr:hypothetical protein H0H92_011018 [Tricholoma furcatifolium]
MAKAFRRFGLSSNSQTPADAVKTVAAAPTLSTADAKKFGLENALYFCTPFRDLMLQSPDSSLPSAVPPLSPSTPLVPVRRKPERKQSTSGSTSAVEPPVAPIPPNPPSLFSALRSLFLYISTHPQQRGTVSPRAFIDKLKELNRIFDTTTHQDAHEFLNYLLNKIVEEIDEERKQVDAPEDCKSRFHPVPLLLLTRSIVSNSVTTLQSESRSSGSSSHNSTLVHRLFEGVLTSETRCLTCETVSSRDESFLDLSIDIEQNSSVTACLRQFSASEMLCHKNKFFCDSCCDLQEAEKRMKIKRLPNVLALHLKRFKYQEEPLRYVKLAYRVAFPFELRLFNTVDEMDDADRLYNLFGIVVHIGNGPNHGHYISIIKTSGTWLLFDDENVSAIPESNIANYFGESGTSAGCAYVLYYQAADIDMRKLGLRPEQTEEFRNTIFAEQATQPVRPPGLAPEDAIPIPPSSESLSSSEQLGPTTPTSVPVPAVPPPSSSPPPSQPIPIPIPIPMPPAPSLHTSISASTSSTNSHSHSQAQARHIPSRSPPGAPPLMSAVSAPPPTKTSGVSVSGILGLKTIRKSPSISIRTSVGQSSAGVAAAAAATTPPTVHTQTQNATNGIPPVPPTPTPTTTRVLVNGVETQSPTSPTSMSMSTSNRSSVNPKPVQRPTTSQSHSHVSTGTSRALPMPPRPTTSGDPERESGWGKWFGGGGGGRAAEPMVLFNGVADGGHGGGGAVDVLVEGHGEGEEEAGSNTSTSLHGAAANGGVSPGKKKDKEQKEKDKEKEKGKGWFGKRKSFRIGGDKSSKNVGTNSTVSTQEPEPSADASAWFRTSLQLPTRRASESGGDVQAPAPPSMAAVRSTPTALQHPPPSPSSSKYSRRPTSATTTTTEQASSHLHLHPHSHDRSLANGEASPTASSVSSFETSSPMASHPASQLPLPPNYNNSRSTLPPQYQHQQQAPHRSHHHHGHGLPNGYPSPPPSQPLPSAPPRMYASTSTPPTAPPTGALPNLPTSAPSTPISPPPSYTRTRTLPDTSSRAPATPGTPHTPERKKSLAHLPGFRGREREREREREKARERDAVAPPRPSTAGAELGRDREREWERERERPLPPPPPRLHVPGPDMPVDDPVELRTGTQHFQVFHANHRRQESGLGGAQVEEPVGVAVAVVGEAPGLSSFGGANTSGGSAATGHGNGNGNGGDGGFKRATRKLSLTAPMLGFGKRDKEKDREKSKEKVAPSSFARA